MTKRIVSLILVLCLCMPLVPVVPVSAEEEYLEFDIGGFNGYDDEPDITIKGSPARITGEGDIGRVITVDGPCVLTLPQLVRGELLLSTSLEVLQDIESWEEYLNGWMNYDSDKSIRIYDAHNPNDAGDVVNPNGIPLGKGIYHCIFSRGGDGYFFKVVVSGEDEPVISVYLNNEKLEFDQPPVIDNDRTLVPLRGIFEAMGFEIDWDETTQSITATNGIHEIVLKIDDTTAYVDGIAHTLDVPAKVINGRTLVPARFVAESVGADVKWDEISNSVNITYEPGSVNISINTSLTDEWYYRREDSMYVQGGYFGKVELVTKDGTPIKNPENYSIQLENTNGFSLDQYGTFSVTANYGATTKINVKNLKGDVISNVVVEVCESPQSFKFVVENIHTINKLQDTSNNYYTYDVVYNDMFTSQDGKQFEDAAMIAYEFWTDPVGYFGKDAKNAYIGLLTEALTNDVALTNMSESIQKEQDKILAEYLVELLGELSNLTGDTSEKVKDSCERIVGDLGFDIMKTTQQMIHDSISSLSYQQKKNLIQKHSADLQIINEELIKEGKQLKFWSNTETACKAMGIAVEGANVIYKGYQQSADIIALQNVREQYRDGLEMLKTPTTNSTIVAAIDEVIAIMDDEFLACAKSIISESGGIRFAAETFVTLFGKSFATKLLSKLGVDVTSAAAANVISKIGAGVNIASTVIATGEITGLVCDIGLGTGTYIAATNELMMLMPLIRDLRAAVSMELRSASDKLNTKDKCIAGFELEKTLCVYASNLVREMCNTKVNSRFVQFVRAVVSKDITLGNSYDSSYDDIYYSEATRIRDLVLIR